MYAIYEVGGSILSVGRTAEVAIKSMGENLSHTHKYIVLSSNIYNKGSLILCKCSKSIYIRMLKTKCFIPQEDYEVHIYNNSLLIKETKGINFI